MKIKNIEFPVSEASLWSTLIRNAYIQKPDIKHGTYKTKALFGLYDLHIVNTFGNFVNLK